MGMLDSRGRRFAVGGSLVGIATAVGLLVAASGVASGPSIDRARRAYERRDWPSAAAIAGRVLDREPGDPEATRVRARGLARLGRFRESIALTARIGGARVEAEDLFLIGQGSLVEHRSALARLALDAAERLDANHPETAEAIDRLGRAARAAGKADRILAIPDPATLSELIVGLASQAPDGPAVGEVDPPLGRILERDRSTFLKLRSPAAARKLLARALLEGGRGKEARDWLDKVEDAGDPEANWLLSRAFLVAGDSEKAGEAARRAGKFGADQPMAPEPSRYAGARRCAGCHPEIYRAQQGSHHSATIARGEGLSKVPLPGAEVVDPENPEVVHRFDRAGEKVRISSTVAGKAIEAVIDHAIGSGHHGITMLARDGDGRHRSLRLSYYSGGQHWGLTSGFEPRPADPASYIGQILNEDSFRNCLNCHTTRFTSEEDRRGPEALDRGIGCERCHGPGENHIRAVESGFGQPAIARPRLASPPLRLKLCAQCHASDGVIPPADPRFIRFQGTTLPYSRCVSEGGGRLDCVACHDPHRDVETSPAHYEARCLTCHGEVAGAARPARTAGLRLEAIAAPPCPTGARAGCIPCHMPKVDNIMPFMSFTDHQIRVHRPADGVGTRRASR